RQADDALPPVPVTANRVKFDHAIACHHHLGRLRCRRHRAWGAQRGDGRLRFRVCPGAVAKGGRPAGCPGDRLVAGRSERVAGSAAAAGAPVVACGQAPAGQAMNPLYVLAALLPVTFVLGWWASRQAGARRSGAEVSELSSDYFRGLNYLLNEEQDKAIEVFLKLAEYNRDTVETHLALGNLFRRRGEVDRAIRLHQHLVSRPNLSEPMKTVALLELGEDYMRAGLLDRAEALFADLVAMNAHAPSALRHLIAIYQHERDWNKAIEHARRLEVMTGEDEAPMIAQFYCELAERSRQHGARVEARDYLEQAFRCLPDCVRAWMLTGRLHAEEGQHAEAVQAYGRRSART